MSNSIKSETDVRLILSGVQALLGAVPPSLRSASIELREDIILWQCVFDPDASDDEIELVSVAGAEIIAGFPDFKIEEIFIRKPTTEMPQDLKNVIFRRHEEI